MLAWSFGADHCVTREWEQYGTKEEYESTSAMSSYSGGSGYGSVRVAERCCVVDSGEPGRLKNGRRWSRGGGVAVAVEEAAPLGTGKRVARMCMRETATRVAMMAVGETSSQFLNYSAVVGIYQVGR